jgi:MOSC domain-containing protein YiiM
MRRLSTFFWFVPPREGTGEVRRHQLRHEVLVDVGVRKRTNGQVLEVAHRLEGEYGGDSAEHGGFNVRVVAFASPHANHQVHCAGDNALLAPLLRNDAVVVGVVGTIA